VQQTYVSVDTNNTFQSTSPADLSAYLMKLLSHNDPSNWFAFLFIYFLFIYYFYPDFPWFILFSSSLVFERKIIPSPSSIVFSVLGWMALVRSLQLLWPVIRNGKHNTSNSGKRNLMQVCEATEL
jgi:hypothetical protein